MQIIFKKYFFPALVVIFLASPLFAHAQFNSNCSMITNQDTVRNACEFLNDIAFFLRIIGMSLATLVIIVGGIKYMTAQDDESKVGAAKKTIVAGIVGFVIVALSATIINLVLDVVINRFG